MNPRKNNFHQKFEQCASGKEHKLKMFIKPIPFPLTKIKKEE